jgi:hypothetical protein
MEEEEDNRQEQFLRKNSFHIVLIHNSLSRVKMLWTLSLRQSMFIGATIATLTSIYGLKSSMAQVTESLMRPVKVIQARVQGDEPYWDTEHQTFISSFGDTFAERYRSVFDSVNTASVEGALMYVQAEGINVVNNPECKRKNNMKYIVFYELSILQTDASLVAYDQNPTNIPEYGPFVAMDRGACTAAGNQLPKECNALFGGNNSNRLGPNVGASLRETDPRAPYPNTIWYSYPHSCVMKTWQEKTPQCRSNYPGGLCAFGSQPDGKECSFTFKTLGFLKIDDLVGISSMQSSLTGANYGNYTEFCMDKGGKYGGIEFSATGTTDDTVTTSIPFWENPFDKAANTARATKMVAMYNKLAAQDPRMTPLPAVEDLTAQNPPCFSNTRRCVDSPNGCKRILYGQVCKVCNVKEDGCIALGQSNE